MIVIRQVDVADSIVRAAIVSLIYDTFPRGTMQANYRPKGMWWLAFDGKDAVGFAGMSPSVQWMDTGYLTLSGVLAAHRGRGLQRKFIQKRIEKAKSLGWHTVVTETIHDNAPSMNNLIACGFRPYTPVKPWNKNYAVYWRRTI